MSIAVSAVVRPSPMLRLLQGGFCLALLAAAALVPAAQAPPLLAAALAALWGSLRRRAAAKLDISGIGQLRLTVYQQSYAAARLLAGSTLWPRLMLLRLQPKDGRACWLLVLPDSVAEGQFRQLALALRAIAARG